MNEPTPEAQAPLSERITPKAPAMPDGKPRSEIYSEVKLGNDYKLFMEGQEGFDPNKPLEQKQRELFSLLEKGEVQDPIQAWEWMTARNWREWDAEDKKLVWDNLTPEQKADLGPIRRIFGQ